MTANFRVGEYACVFDGQSLTVWPSPFHVNSFPMKMMVGRPAARHIAGIGGYSWSQLDNDFESRIKPFAKIAYPSFYVMCGGTTQVVLGQTPSTIYNSEKNMSDLAKAAGYTYVFGSTTTPCNQFGDAVLTIDATGGTFILTYRGQDTQPLSATISSALLQTELEDLSNISPGDVSVTGSAGGPYTIQFVLGYYSGALIVDDSGLTGGGSSATISTRLDTLNDLKRADSLDAYDLLVDLDLDSRLSDPFNATYYVDAVHPTTFAGGGTEVMAELFGAELDAFLATLP